MENQQWKITNDKSPTTTASTTTPGMYSQVMSIRIIIAFPLLTGPFNFSACDGALGRVLLRADTESDDDDKEAAGTKTNHKIHDSGDTCSLSNSSEK